MEQITNQINKDNKEDKRISIAIMSSFAILTIQYLILYYFNLMGSALGNTVQLASKILVGFLFLLGLPAVLRRNWILFIGTYVFFVGIFLYNYLFFGQNLEFLKDIIFPFFFTCLPSLLYSYSVRDIKVFKDVMENISRIVFILGLLISILVFTNKMSLGSYSMSLSYYMLLPAIIYLNNSFKDKKAMYINIFILSMLIILILGARGPLMCIGIFTLLYMITNKSKLNYKTLFQFFGSSLFFILVFINLNKMIMYLYNFLINLGLNSRTLLLILTDELSSSRSRNNLYIEIIELIKENPIFGIGIGGDRYYTGMYSHNIFIEILSGFGVIVGILVMLLLLLFCYKVIKLKNKDDNNLMIIWISIGLVPLLVSGSYLTDFKFWIFLGLGLNNIKGRILMNKSQYLR